MVDGSQAGTFSNRDDLIKGSTFTLLDGSKLSVQYSTDLLSRGFHITYNGKHIPASSGGAEFHLNQVSGLLVLLAMIKVGFALLFPLKKAAGFLTADMLNAENVAIGLVYLACALPIRRAWLPAVWVTAVAAAIDALFTLTSGILKQNVVQIFGALIVAGCIALLLTRIVVFLQRERNAAAETQLR